MPSKRRSWNPIAFVPLQVTVISSLLYIALFAFLIWSHEHVPSAPSSSTPVKGVNLTQAWLDLSYISNGYHPIDSRRNGEVKEYLLERIDEILEHNGADSKRVTSVVEIESKKKGKKDKNKDEETDPTAVTVFVDGRSNVTFVDDFSKRPWTCYSESENIMVYIRGKNDEDGDWWGEEGPYSGPSGVLVNAHYDSVSSGFGATDDGVGVVTILQLISHFTTDGNRPKRGIVALFNNGEENGLYGAHSYLRHPLSQFTHTFLNLEGAGAGGRAVLFRSTDVQVTKFYAQSPYPYGSVISADGFKRGLVRSGTDYSVFNGDNGMRGLDVAFFKPRSRYHTADDDVRDTSADSVWHMLSAALATMKAMTSYSGDEFEGKVDNNGKLDINTGSDGVWFDLFGLVFAVMELGTLFALTVTLAAVGPVILIILEIVLRKSDKWYLLAKRQYVHSSDDDEAVHFSGVRGLFRLPIAFILSSAAVLALAYLLAKINPLIIYSSEYAVWAMMFAAWFSVAWFVLAGADRVRPTALQRMYVLIWVYAFSWVLLVGNAVGENNFHMAGGYFLVIYNASVFLALLISYLEFFALPTKTSFVEHVANADEEIERRSVRPGSQSSRQVFSQSASQRRLSGGNEDDEANERTSLLRGRERRSGKRRHPDNDGTLSETNDPYLTKAYGDEQAWSSSLPQWTWIVQFLVLAPINIIIVGQIALFITSALGQTPADGSSPLTVYLFIAMLTVLLLLPLTPFLHRFTYQVPTFLFLVFIGCLVYNLLAFPFSRDARMHAFFVQRVDLDSGLNNVTLTGAMGYVQDIVGELPSAIGQKLHCTQKTVQKNRAGLVDCTYRGLAPNVVGDAVSSSAKNPYKSWVDYNVSHSGSTANFTLRGQNTKSCRFVFDQPVSEVQIDDAASDPRYASAAEGGSTQIHLFSRTWDKTFQVNVTWKDQDAKGQTGKVGCLWSDVNVLGTVPAYDEFLRFQPVWSVATKASDGLVEGWKTFSI